MRYKLFENGKVLSDYNRYCIYHHDGCGRSWEEVLQQRRNGVIGVWLTDQLIHSQLFRALVDD